MCFRPLIFLGLILSLGACATAPKANFLSQPEQAALGTVDGIVVATQSAPRVTVTRSNPAGVGGWAGVLAFAIADEVRSANARADTVPINDALQGLDFQAELLAATTARVGSLSNIKVAIRPTVDTVGTLSVMKTQYDESRAASVLFFVVKYTLVSGDLVLTASARIFPKSPELNKFRPKPNDNDPLDIGNAIYDNKFQVQKWAVTPTNIRTNLVEGINQLTARLATDLNSAR